MKHGMRYVALRGRDACDPMSGAPPVHIQCQLCPGVRASAGGWKPRQGRYSPVVMWSNAPVRAWISGSVCRRLRATRSTGGYRYYVPIGTFGRGHVLGSQASRLRKAVDAIKVSNVDKRQRGNMQQEWIFVAFRRRDVCDPRTRAPVAVSRRDAMSITPSVSWGRVVPKSVSPEGVLQNQ